MNSMLVLFWRCTRVSQFPWKHSLTHTHNTEQTLLKATDGYDEKLKCVNCKCFANEGEKNTMEKQICTLPIWKWLPSNNYCLQHVTRPTMIIIYSLTKRVSLWHERHTSGIRSMAWCIISHYTSTLHRAAIMLSPLITAFWSITFFSSAIFWWQFQ